MKPIKLKLNKSQMQVFERMMRLFICADMGVMEIDEKLQHLMVAHLLLKPYRKVFLSGQIMEANDVKKITLNKGEAAVFVFYRAIFFSGQIDEYSRVVVRDIIDTIHQQLV